MPRSVRGSDEDEEVKPGRKTRATTDVVSVDSPLRRSSRFKPVIKENESSPEILLSDTNNVINTQTTKTRTRQKLAMDSSTTENCRTLRSRINSVSSDISEVAETDVTILSKRTRNTTFSDTPSKTNNRRSSRRLTRAGSEANSPPPATRVTRSTRASSMEPETDTRNNESHVKIRKRISMLPSEITVIEEKIPVVSLNRTLPDANTSNTSDLKNSPNASVKESNNLSIENVHTSTNEKDTDTDNMQTLTLSPETESVNEGIHSETSKKNISLETYRNSSSNNSTEDMECVKHENEAEDKHSVDINTASLEQSEKTHDKENNKDVKMDISVEKVIMDENKESKDEKTITSENIHENNEIIEKTNTLECTHEDEINEKANTSKHVYENNETSEEANTSEHVHENNETSEKANASEHVHENNETNEKANTSEHVYENNETSEKANASENIHENNEIIEKAHTLECAHEDEINEKANTSEHVHENNETSEKANTSEHVHKNNETSEEVNTSEHVQEDNETSKKENISDIAYKNNEMNKTASTPEKVHENNKISEETNMSENVDKISDITNESNTSENVYKTNEGSCINAFPSPNLSNVKLSTSVDKILITDIPHSQYEDKHDLEDSNRMNNSSSTIDIISESSDACMSLKDSTVNNISGDNVLNVVKSSQSFTVTEVPAEFNEEILEGEGQSKKVPVLDNSLKKQLINELDEGKSEANQGKNINNPKDTEVDNDSDTNVASLFQDILTSEWKQKNADSEKNSVHSISTEKLENESEGECDLVLIDQETFPMEDVKIDKKNEIFDYDSDDTVVVKMHKSSIKAVNEEELAMDTSESKCKLNVSKDKCSDTKERKSMEHKEINNEENVMKNLKDVQDWKNTSQNLESSKNIKEDKSIVVDTNNKRSASKCNILNESKGDKSLSKLHKTIEKKEDVSLHENNLSEDVPKKQRSINKSKQDTRSMSDSDNSENKFVMLRKLFFNAQSDTNSDNDEDESNKSIDSDVQKEYNLYGKDDSKFSDDDVPGDECRASETESSDPDDNGSDLADFVVEEGEEESEDDEENESENEDEDEVQKNESEHESEGNENEVEAKEHESEIENERDESEVEVEIEESESKEKGGEIKIKELDDKDSKIHQKPDEEEMQEEDENMDVEEEQNENCNKQKRNADTCQVKKDKNENSLADSSHSNTLKTKKRVKARSSGEFIVEDLEQSLNESQLIFNKKMLKLDSMQYSTPKTNSSKQVTPNISMETSKTKNSGMKHKKENSNICEVVECDSFNKEKSKNTPLKEKNLKKLSKTLNEGHMHQNLSPELLTLLTKTNLSRTMSSKVSELNKTTLAPESITPTTKYLMKEKLSATAPTLKLNTTYKKLMNTSLNKKSNMLNQTEENKNTGEPNVKATQDINESLKRKLFKITDSILKIDEEKKHKKRKQSVIETTDLLLSENEDEDSEIVKKNDHMSSTANTDDNDEAEEEHVVKKQKKKKKKTGKEFIETEQMNNNETTYNMIKIKKEKRKIGSNILSTNEETKILPKKEKLSSILSNENEEVKMLKKKKPLNTLPRENDENKTLKKKKKKKLLNSVENENKDVKLIKKKKKVLSDDNGEIKILKKKKKVSNTSPSENEETKTLKKKEKLLNASISENNDTKILEKKKKKKEKLFNASPSENEEIKTLKKKKKVSNTSTNEEDVKPIKKKKKVSAVLSNENKETEVPKKKKKIPNAVPNENEGTQTIKEKEMLLNPLPSENKETKILKKKKKLLNAAANEDKDIKSVNKKKKVLSNKNGETKILKKKKKVLNVLQSENEEIKTTTKTKEISSDDLPSKTLSKKKKKLLLEDRTLQDEDDLFSLKRKQKLLLQNTNQDNLKVTNVTHATSSVTSQLCNDTVSDSDEGPQVVGFSEARNEVFEMLRNASDSIKASQETKKKKQREHMERMQRQKEIKIKKLKSKNQTVKMNKVEPQRTSIKRLSDEDLEKLSDVPRLAKKKKFPEMEDHLLVKSKGKGIKNTFVESDSASLNSCISTTEFSVVSLETIKKHKKGSEISSFKQRMLARNSREPVAAYLMYLKKQKASGKSKFYNNA